MITVNKAMTKGNIKQLIGGDLNTVFLLSIKNHGGNILEIYIATKYKWKS